MTDDGPPPTALHYEKPGREPNRARYSGRRMAACGIVIFCGCMLVMTSASGSDTDKEMLVFGTGFVLILTGLAGNVIEFIRGMR